ncbi:hypothetical protein HUG17_4106 [Dermatophagoides farinae]|uniref:Transmembrane protein n=1 Tax=Dermatophagoides farinae TaxID=6954 RepID=A0A9D4SFS8_DERFA|nr:hypothetical protein HUG17_4106 [Dermatophagoides farinae]
MDDQQRQRQPKEQNYLLRWMIIFFGNIIIQFEWKKQWQNTLNMCYNYSMHLLFIYSALTGQLYSATSNDDLTIERVKIKIYNNNVIVYTDNCITKL